MRLVILRTIHERERGLQFLHFIPEETLYVFEDISEGNIFHSENVPEPFDIAFLDENFTVLGMARMRPPRDRVKAPPGTALALESKGGRMKTFGIHPGTRFALL